MPEKDITEKTLESYGDVFADIANILLFHGSPVIKENELEDAIVRSHYKADGNIRIAFAGLSEEQLKMFQSDFKIIADKLQRMKLIPTSF